MTVDEFEMDPHYHLYRKNEIEWDVKARDGDVKIEFSVYDENIQEAVKDNFENFFETVEQELTERVENMCDLGEISDAEKRVFLVILGKVIG